MKKLISLFIIFATFLSAAFGKTVYVNANYPANGDGTSWSSPYTNLQDAVTAAVAGDLVLVTNGVYSPISTGNKAITIQSVEGSSVTSIDGGGTTRCATLGTGVVLKGFTVCNGYTTGNGGGVISGSIYDSVVSNNLAATHGGGISGVSVASNCVIRGNTAATYGGGAHGSTLTDCTISGNTADRGGGSAYGTLTGCTISGNTANLSAGGSHDGTLTGCVISNNIAVFNGGGSYQGTLTGCTISGNTANQYGGGSYNSTVYDSDIIGNISSKTSYAGGGTYGGTLYRCRIYNNSAPNGYGGGANRSILYDCVITNNTAIRGSAFADAGRTYNCIMSYNIATQGGVTYYGTHDNSTIVNNQCGVYTTWNGTYRNSIIWGNSTTDHYAAFDVYEYSNADTLISGVGNISVDPLFVDSSAGDFRLQPTSPCINKGANQYVTTATDFLGSPRIKDWRVDMGAYESQSTRFVTTPNALFPMGTKDVPKWTPARLAPLAWYKGDGNATDAMGNYDGTWVGTEAYADGVTGQAFDFDGSSYINCGNVGIGDEFTVALWVKGGVQPGNYRRLITKGIGNETGSWQVHTSAGTLTPFVVRVDSSEQFNASHHIGNLLTEEWVHLACVFSKANSTIQVFLGGGLSRMSTVKYGTGITNNTPLTIASNASGAYPLLGKISDVLIFDRALSPTEVKKLYDETVKQNGEPW